MIPESMRRTIDAESRYFADRCPVTLAGHRCTLRANHDGRHHACSGAAKYEWSDEKAIAVYGPNRDETLDQVQQRLERQATANDLVIALAEWHGRASRYEDSQDFARQVATVLLAQFDVRRR